MTNARVKEVMTASFQKFNIQLESNGTDLLQEMIDNLSGEKSGVQLPYLQVYLDMLYRENYQQTYTNEKATESLPSLNFTQESVANLGRIENVLEKFLYEQEEDLQEELKKDFGDLPEKAVANILDAFVTEEGTKRPLYYQREGELILVNTRFKDLLPNIPAATLSSGLISLEQRRLVRFTENTIELAHDSLANLIDQKRSDTQRQLNAALRQIKSAYAAFGRTKEFLSQKQLAAYEDYIPKLSLEPDVLEFIENSRADAGAKEAAEKKRQQRELELTQEKLADERFFTRIIGIIATFAIVVSLFAWQQRNNAVRASNNLSQEVFQTQLRDANVFKIEGKYGEALAQLDTARSFAANQEDLNEIERLKQQWSIIYVHVAQGDSLLHTFQEWKKKLPETQDIDSYPDKIGLLIEALEEFNLALEKNSDAYITSKQNEVKQNINLELTDLKSRAKGLLGIGNCLYAKPLLLAAQRLNPNEREVSEILENRLCQ